MLVTRLCDTLESSHWPFSSYKGTPYGLQKPRMSERPSLPPPVEPDWPGQYSSFTQNDQGVYTQQSSLVSNRQNKPAFESGGYNDQGSVVRREGDQFNFNAFAQHPKTVPSEFDSSSFGSKVVQDSSARNENLASEPLGFPRVHETAASVYERSHVEHASGTEPSLSDGDDNDVDDDNDHDNSVDGQTAAERLAARRKMKRFRLTHQQTRFLMSEFAKQPHPDAAHRERLSREIPGLSPRQVQVWFQNRRAKIKRLTVDDRDRMIRMRAVPDDFDNIQALHSPYGAVQGTARQLPIPSASSVLSTTPFVNDPRHHFSSTRRLGGNSFIPHSSISHNLSGININQPGHLGSTLTTASTRTYHDPKLSGGVHPSSMHLQDLGSQYSLSQWNSNSSSVESNLSLISDRQGLRHAQPWLGREWSTNHRLVTEQSDQSPRREYNAAVSFGERQRPYAGSSLSQQVGLPDVEHSPYSGSEPLPGRESGVDHSAETPVPARSTSASLPVTFDFGFRDAYRSAGIPTSSPQTQARQQASPEVSRAQGSPAAMEQGYPSANPLASLNSPSSRPFQMPPNHPTNHPSVPSASSGTSEIGRSYQSGVSGAGGNNDGGPLKDLFGHGVL